MSDKRSGHTQSGSSAKRDFGDAALAGAVVTAASPTGRAATIDTAKLAAKYGFKTVELGGKAVGLAGAPLVLGWTGYQAYDSVREGKPVQGLMNIVPAIPEMYEVGVAGVAFRQALQQGVWQAAKAGGARLITGTSFAVGAGGGLALTLAVDLGMTVAHEAGWNVDNGFIASAQNRVWNANNAAVALFPEDTPPLLKDLMSNSSTKTTQTGPYEYTIRTEFEDTFSEDFGGTADKEPIVWTSNVKMNGVGNFFNQELKYFSTFHGNFPAVRYDEKTGKSEMLADKSGKIMMDEKMSMIAQGMYENPDQAFGMFRDFLYSRTVETALQLAEDRKIKVNGDGQQLNSSDKIPPALMKEAAQQTMSNFRAAYQYGGNFYFEKALNYLDPKFIRPENIDIAKVEAYNFIENRFQGRVETLMDDKGGFNWSNSTHLAAIHSAIDKAIELNRPATPLIAHPRRASSAPSIQPLGTKLSAEEQHTAKQDVLNAVMTPGYMQDTETGQFKHNSLGYVQKLMVQAGLLSATYQTGNINGQTIRAIDNAIKGVIDPKDITPDQKNAILDNARKLSEDLKANPADSTSLDPRVLAFQTNAYLLGTYNGRLDGLSGPKTAEAQNTLTNLTEPQAQTPQLPTDSLTTATNPSAIPLAAMPTGP